MGRVPTATIACLLALAATSFAEGYPPQDFPTAPLRADGTKQGGRLAEASVSYRTGPDQCVTAGVLGDGRFPGVRRVASDGDTKLRFRLNAERRPKVSLRYWSELDSDGYAEGDPTGVPIEVAKRKPNGDFILQASLDTTDERYLRLSAFWKGKGICRGQEFLLNHYSLAPEIE